MNNLCLRFYVYASVVICSVAELTATQLATPDKPGVPPATRQTYFQVDCLFYVSRHRVGRSALLEGFCWPYVPPKATKVRSKFLCADVVLSRSTNQHQLLHGGVRQKGGSTHAASCGDIGPVWLRRASKERCWCV